MHSLDTIKSEKGSVLIVAIFVLFIMTVMGLAATTTSTIDLQITQNQRDYVQEFYVADSGWKTAANWLNSLGGTPSEVNTSGNIVRNFGDGAQDVLNDTFPAGTEDGTINGIGYWYRVRYVQDEIVPGSGKQYRRFLYATTCNADRAQEIEVGLGKVFRVGY
jgi:Tfp pilus assembly protein PilX